MHIGTGNYNRATAQIYTDLGLFTANPRIAADASELFNYLTGYSRQRDYRELMVAPVTLRERLERLIERETEHLAVRPCRRHHHQEQRDFGPGHHQAPVRRITGRRPGAGARRGASAVSGRAFRGSATPIEVRSIVGRFLEHSRIYYFENGGHPELYLGSADLMERNLDRRVETLCPVLDPDLRRFIRETILEAYLSDTQRASVLQSDGTYVEPAVDRRAAHRCPAAADVARRRQAHPTEPRSAERSIAAVRSEDTRRGNGRRHAGRFS